MIHKEVQIGDCRLILGDCLEILPTLAPGSVDAVVTDPPYGVGFKYGFHDDTNVGYESWCKNWFSMLKANAIAITSGTVNVAMWCKIKKPKWIVAWYKPACMGNSPFGACHWEPVLFWGKARHNSGCDVVRAVVNVDVHPGHPCPKPLKWASGLIPLVSGDYDTILDPFMGSGTTGVACIRTGRKFIGIEIDENYFNIAVKRIQKEYDDHKMDLFQDQRPVKKPKAVQPELDFTE